jgi:hypothetical protein
MGLLMVGVPKEKKEKTQGLFMGLLFANNIYLKQI